MHEIPRDNKYLRTSSKNFSLIFSHKKREFFKHLLSAIKKLNFFRNEIITAENTFLYLKNLITAGDFILDVGAGTGLVADLIRKNTKCDIQGIDIVNHNRTQSPILLYDGKNFPFCDNSFSAVICCFVLHHTENQEQIIKEINRITSSRIYIFEDIPITFLDNILLKIHDYCSRHKYKSKKLAFRKIEDWQEVFRIQNLEVAQIIEINKSRQWWNPVSRRLFILHKSNNQLSP